MKIIISKKDEQKFIQELTSEPPRAPVIAVSTEGLQIDVIFDPDSRVTVAGQDKNNNVLAIIIGLRKKTFN